MSRSDDIYAFIGELHYIGLSSIIGITVLAGQVVATLKHGGGGTLWAGGSTVAINSGYLVSTGEAINVNSSTTIYFVAASATCTLYSLRGRSPGYDP